MPKPIHVDRNRVRQIIDNIVEHDKAEFTLGLVDAFNEVLSTDDEQILDDYLADWEDIIELDSIPGFRENVWKAHQSLIDSGRVDGNTIKC